MGDRSAMWFQNMKIGSKLLFAFIMVALLAGLVGVIGIVNINSVENQGRDINSIYGKSLQNTGAMSVDFQKIQVHIRDMILAQDPTDINRLSDSISTLRADIDNQCEQYYQTIDSPEMAQAYDEMQVARKAYAGHLEQIGILAAANKDLEAIALLHGEMQNAANGEQAAIDRLTTLKIQSAQAGAEKKRPDSS